MLVLLPPSETKRDGGRRSPLNLSRLTFAGELTTTRAILLAKLNELVSGPEGASLRALKISPKQSFELEHNRTLLSSPTMPALDRYTGVLYDAIDSGTLTTQARRYARKHLLIHSALFGLTGALDRIPRYRFSHDSKLPDIRLAQTWSPVCATIIAEQRGLIVDLRSESYVHLGVAPKRKNSIYVRVVTLGPEGAVRALNHFNKHTKGLFVRSLLDDAPPLRNISDLLVWCAGAGWRVELDSESDDRPELKLII